MKLPQRYGPTLLALLAGLVLVAAVSYKLVREHNVAINVARTQTQNLVGVLEEHARQSLHRVGNHLNQASETLNEQRADNISNKAFLRSKLIAILPADRLISAFLVLDKNGVVQLSTLEPGEPVPAVLADRDYFVPHIGGSDRELVFGALEKNPATGSWTLPVSRSTTSPTGQWDGVLVAMVEPHYFQSFYDSIDSGNQGLLSLFLTSGWAAVTSPQNPAVLSLNWLNSPLFSIYMPQWPTGTVHEVQTMDGVERIYSYRVMNDYPVVLSYGLSMDSVLAGWRRGAWMDATLMLIGLLTLAGVSLVLTRHDNRRRATERTLKESQERYRVLTESSPVGIAAHKDGRFVYANPACIKLLGATCEADLLKKPILEFVHPDFQPVVVKQIKQRFINNSGVLDKLEVKLVRLDGQAINAEVEGILIPFEGSQASQISIIDITERKRADESLRVAAIAFEAQEGIFVTDANNIILRVNSAFTRMTGYSADEAVGQTPGIFRSSRHSADFYSRIWQTISASGSWQGELWNRSRNGSEYPTRLSITVVKDIHGQLTHYVATMVDITQDRAAADVIEKLGFYDLLTELPNRRLLINRLQQAVESSAKHGQHGSLLFLDLDNFKVLNDTQGHDAGDALLLQVAQRLTGLVREGDTVARFGGDEFVVLLENLSQQASEAKEQTQRISEEILHALNLPYILNVHQHHSSVSVGAVQFKGQQSAANLLKQADIAMYAAKTAGRNTVRFFDPEMQACITERAALDADLREALNQQQLRLYFQKQVSHDGHTVGAEVLLRWQHPQRGLVLPDQIIPLAEESGQIVAIGVWLLHEACQQLKRWQSDPLHHSLSLSVNVSAGQFKQPDFVEQVKHALTSTGARAAHLKLELTESTAIDNVDDTVGKMNALKTLGVTFAIDDFGTGQSSLSYLTQLPLDQIKIDQSFVRHIGRRPQDALIVQTIIGMAHNLGMEVVAEGVETQAQCDFLVKHDCLLFQGYLFGRAVPLDAFEQKNDSLI
jgi:diguanylate cyclase (GGDEF)-like protein/PAS domain S-box-containing protein